MRLRAWSFCGLETIVAWREATQYWTRGDDEGQSVHQMRYFLVIYINLDMYVIKSMSYVMYIYLILCLIVIILYMFLCIVFIEGNKCT